MEKRSLVLAICWALPFLVAFVALNYLAPGLFPVGWIGIGVALLACLGTVFWSKLHYRVAKELLVTHPFKTCVYGSMVSSLVVTLATVLLGGVVFLFLPTFWQAFTANPGSSLAIGVFVVGNLLLLLLPLFFLSSLVSSVLVKLLI